MSQCKKVCILRLPNCHFVSMMSCIFSKYYMVLKVLCYLKKVVQHNLNVFYFYIYKTLLITVKPHCHELDRKNLSNWEIWGLEIL